MHINITLKGACLLLLFFTSQSVISQKYFHGVLEDAQTLLPVGNVNIFYGDSGIGTVSNNEGAFELIVPENTPEQQLHFKHLIYKEITVDNALGEVIYLEPSVYELEEVLVSGYDKVYDELIVSLDKISANTSFCEKFFYKEFLKENNEYVNYVEALGVCVISSKGVRNIYVKGKRQTEVNSIGFVKFNSNVYNLFKKVDLVRKSKVINRKLINKTTYKITLKSLEDNHIYDVYAEKGTYTILKIISNTLNDQMDLVSSSQKGFYLGQVIDVNIYQQGMVTEIDFKKVNGENYIHKIAYKVKMCMQSKDKSLAVDYMWDRFYLNTGFYTGYRSFNSYTRLTDRSNFFEKKVVNNIIDWSAENRVLPIDNELEILNVLDW